MKERTPTDTDLVLSSLEIASEKAGDVAPQVYERYYATCPGSQELMNHVDQYIQGRMMAEVLRLVMTPEPRTEREYLRFETRSHESYGVRLSMYHDLFTSLRDVVRDALSDDWNNAFESAWERRLNALLAEIATSASDDG